MLSESVSLEQNADPHHISARVVQGAEVGLFGEEDGVVLNGNYFVSKESLCTLLAIVVAKTNPQDPLLQMLDDMKNACVRQRDPRKTSMTRSVGLSGVA